MKYAYMFGGAIGDSLLGIHVGRVLSSSVPGEKIILISTRKNQFVRELVSSLSFVSYYEVIKTNPLTWAPLFWLMLHKTGVAFIEPSDVPIPLWWKIVASICTCVPGSTEVHGQVVGHERRNKKNIHTVIISPEGNLFTTFVPKVLRAWNISPISITPSLTKSDCVTAEQPYILFHFFAGNYRRSFPPEKVQPLLMEARKQFPSYTFILSAAPNEHARAVEMIAGISNARIESRLTSNKILCLLQGASVTVGVASGITHIAAHLDVPSVVLANLSDPYWLPTYNEKVALLSDIEHCRCKGNKTGVCAEHTRGGDVFRCLYYISQDSIIENIGLILQK